MFKKLLAAAGIGGANVDTRLRQHQLVPGQLFEGDILIRGGNAPQQIGGIDLALMTRVKHERESGTQFVAHCLASWRIEVNALIQPGELREVPFRAHLHPETPFTRLPVRNNQCQVWLTTEVDIAMGLDPQDKDLLEIVPTPVLDSILNAMNNLGFALRKADVEAGYLRTASFKSTSGCYQELEFRPKAQRSRLNEVEISLVCEAHMTHVLIELDRAFRGDGYVSFSVDNKAPASEIQARLQQILR